MKTWLLPIACVLGLSACNPLSNEVSCSSPDVAVLMNEIIKENLESQLTQEMNSSNIANQHIKDLIQQLGIQLGDVRTHQKPTEQNNKYSCEASLQLSIPENIIKTAVSSKNILEGNSDGNADFFENEYKLEGASYNKNVHYLVQPTDDGKKVYVELTHADETIQPIKELLSYALMENVAKEVQQLAKSQEAEFNQLYEEQLAARLNEVKSQWKLADTELNNVWNGFPEAIRNKLKENQKAWLNSHRKECEFQSKSGETQPQAQEIAYLECQVERIGERINELHSKASNMSGELEKAAEQKFNKALSRLQRASNKVSPDILQQIGFNENWAEHTTNQCQQQSDSTLAFWECATRAFDQKAKELEGYAM